MPGKIARMAVMCVAVILFVSCASLSRSGVGRVKRYEIASERLPRNFDGCDIAFISDTHYPSKFTRKRLARVVRKLRKLQPQMLLLGGDYVTADECIDELFDSLSSVKTPFGTYAVLGNHEFSRTDIIKEAMRRHGVRLLQDEAVALTADSALFVVGVKNPFKVDTLAPLPTAAIADSAFVILLAHTPDYAQRAAVRADVVLAGHTHGGQVTLLGLYAPVTNSLYGRRFLTGLNRTTQGVPVITTNGIGTSRRRVRLCAPSEIVIVTLRRVGKK